MHEFIISQSETKDESTDEIKEEPDKEKSESGDVKVENGTKVEESKKKDRVKLMTKDQSLLLAFLFFDRSRCGYIFDKDLESLVLSLGLQLSRHQVNIDLYRVLICRPRLTCFDRRLRPVQRALY